jgi:hypothetical protein
MPKLLYFHELTLEQMLESHDFTYEYSDDHRYYTQGSQEYKIINNKVKEMGGWTKELTDLWNKYAPNSHQKDWEWINKYQK